MNWQPVVNFTFFAVVILLIFTWIEIAYLKGQLKICKHWWRHYEKAHDRMEKRYEAENKQAEGMKLIIKQLHNHRN